jgi:hypothetical protein
MDTRGSSLTENLQECEAHPSSPSSAEFKNDRSYSSIPQYAFMACPWKLCHEFNNIYLEVVRNIVALIEFPFQSFISKILN